MGYAATVTRPAGPTARTNRSTSLLASRGFARPRAPDAQRREPASETSKTATGGPSFSFGRLPIQRKLVVGAVDDPLEREADAVADQVMRMPDPALSIGPAPLQISRKCAECEREDEDKEKLQMKPANASRPQTGEPPAIVHGVLRSPGQPLDAATRGFFESRFRRDFSEVRVHAGASAAQSARDLNAHAYTVGNNIAFGSGRFAPGTQEGQRLLAHELTHVAQQSRFGPNPGLPQILRREPAGGCGLCYGDKELGISGPPEAGKAAHQIIQETVAKTYQGARYELSLGQGRVDLAVINDADKKIEIGEIKPANDKGVDDGLDQIESRLEPQIYAEGAYKGYTPAPLRIDIPQPMKFYTDAPICKEQPGFCFSQDLLVSGRPKTGIYFYACDPPYSQLLRLGCKCKCKDDEDQERKQPVKSDRPDVDLSKPSSEGKGRDPADSVKEPEGTGIDSTDVAIYATATVAAATALNIAVQKAKTKAEEELARKALERIAGEAERRGAKELAETLDTKNVSKLGTKAYERILEEAEKKAAARLAKEGEERIAEKLVTKLGEKAARNGAKTLLEKGSKAIPYIGLAITIYELGSAADAYAKGADIQFGLSGSDVNLSGDTNVDVKGNKGKGGVTSDVKLTDTQIDMDVAAPPNASGIIGIEAKNATIKGKMPTAEGSKITVNMSFNLENTTIIYKSIGHLKGGNIVIDGALDIKDATIEIDIPDSNDVEVPQGEGEKREIKGVKLKVTKPGASSADAGAAKQAAKEGAKGADETKSPDAAERAKLLTEIDGDARLKKIYDNYFTKKGIPPLEALRRLAALKARLQAHPELLDKIFEQLKPTGEEVKDPIKDFIEPLEQALDAAEKPAEANAEPPKAGAPADTPQAGKKDPSAEKGTQANEAERAKATAISLWKVLKPEYIESTADQGEPSAPTSAAPAAQIRIPVNLPRETTKGPRDYRFYIDGALIKQRDAAHVSPRFAWSGDYKIYPPGQILKSTQGDEPIYFTDVDQSNTVEWGLIKKKDRNRKKTP